MQRTICLGTSPFSWLSFCGHVFPDKVPVIRGTMANPTSSLFYQYIALIYIELTVQSSYIPLVSGGHCFLFLSLSLKPWKELTIAKNLSSIFRYFLSNFLQLPVWRLSKFCFHADQMFSQRTDDAWISKILAQPSKDTPCNGAQTPSILPEIHQ